MPCIGIVTVTYNSRKVIDGFLASLRSQAGPKFLLYVVDNNSSDGTLERLGEEPDVPMHIIQNKVNQGAAEGNNQGIKAALADGCDSILLINNDTEFGPSLLENLADGLAEHQADMAVPKILVHDQGVIWSAGGGFNSRRGYSAFLYGYGQKDRGQFDKVKQIQQAPTTCMLIRSVVFDKVGLLDAYFFAYHEDTDFCYRAYRAGVKLIYLPQAVVQHKVHSLTGGPFSKTMMRYTTRNRVYFLLKHLGLAQGFCYVWAYQAYLIFQLLSKKFGFSMYWLRQKALLEGVRLWRDWSLGNNK